MTGSGSAPTRSLDREALTRYVLDRQTPTGGFCFYRTPEWGVDEPNAPDTLAALESLRLVGRQAPVPELTAAWLQTLQQDDGGFATLRIGWAALRALQTLGVQPRRSADAWAAGRLRRVLQAPPIREWRSALFEFLELVELLPAVHIELEQQQHDALRGLLEAARMPGGGWTRDGIELESTAVAVRVLQLARLPIEQPDTLRRLVAECGDSVLGLRISPEAGATSAATLHAGLVLATALGIQPTYPESIASNIALLQRRDGGLGRRDKAISTLQDTWLGLAAEQLLHDLRKT